LHNYIIPIILLLFANSTLLFSALSPQQSSTPASVETPTTLPTITPLRADEIKDSNPIERGMNSQSEQTNQGIPTPPPNPTKTTVPNKPPTHIEDNTQARVSIPVQLVEEAFDQDKESFSTNPISDLPNAQTQASSIEVDFVSVSQVPEELHAAILFALEQNEDQLESKTLSSTSFRMRQPQQDWVYVVLLPTNSLGESIEETPLSTYVSLLGRKSNNQWEFVIEGQPSFALLARLAPSDFIDFGDMYKKPSEQSPNQTLNFLFPWTTGHRWYKTQGWHGGNPSPWMNSLDFQPTARGSNLNLSQDFAVLASEQGRLEVNCNDGLTLSLVIYHPNGQMSGYVHLDARNYRSDLIGKQIQRGQYLGYLYRTGNTNNGVGGAYSTACGNGQAAHLHFVLPTRSMNINGYSAESVSAAAFATIYTSSNNRIDNQPVNQNPNPPVVNSSITVDYRNIVISWQDGGDPDNGPRNYRDYYVNIWNDGQTWQQGSGWITATSWSVTLPISGRYYVSVQAGDGAGASLNNPVHMIDVILFPHKPTNLVMASRTTSSLTMTWHDNANDEAGYRVYRWHGEDDTWIRMAELGANSTSYTNSNLNCDSPYYYRVSAFNGNRESFIDDWTQGITSACQKPAMPGTPFVTALSTSSASIAWEDRSNNETGFNIYRWGQRNDVWDFYWYASVGSNVTQFIDTNLECKVTYFYFIAAYNEYGESEYTPWTEAPTYECSNIPPNPPDHVTPIYNDIFGPTLYFSWYDGGDPDNGPSQKRQYFVIARNEDYTWYAESGWMSLQYWDVPVPAKGRYYFTVIAYDGAHNSLNNPWYIADTVSLPKEPQVFRVTTTTANSIHLEWYEGSSNTHGYYLYRWRVSDQSWQKIATLEADDLEFTDTNLDCNRLYTYSLSAFNEDGEKFVEDPLQANTANCTQAAATATPKPAPTATPKPTPTKTYRIALPFVRR
jgi:murein DD-endopeptidase MepM/ murein hydrolase activator NlpD